MKTKTTIFVQVLLMISICFTACKEENLSLSQSIEKQIAQYEWAKADSPGFAISILEKDSLVYSKGYGLSDMAQHKKNTANTIFNIGSVSKSITAACILKLVEQNKLELEASLSDFFPETSPKIGQATVQQLLNHTSGIRDNESFGQLIEAKGIDRQTGFFIGNDQDNWDLLKRQTHINFPHGSTYLYNNMGYWLLAQIVEKVSQEPIEDFANKELFAPLGMTNTSFGRPLNQEMALGYHAFNPTEKPKQINLSSDAFGDGGVYSSTADLVIWFNEIMNGEKFGQDFWQAMKTKGLLNNKTETAYGAGLHLKNINKALVFSHGGVVPGYQAMVKAFPKQKVVIAVIANQTQIDASQIVSMLEEAMRLKAEKPEIIALSEAESKKYLGEFQQTIGSSIGSIRHIIKKGNDFFYHRPQSVDSQIFPIGSDEFIMPFGNMQADIKITTDPVTNKRQLRFKGNDGEADRIYSEITVNKPINVSKTELSKFPGSYKSEETQLTWNISLEKEKLYMDVNTFKAELNAVSKDVFSMEGRFTIKFNYDEQKEPKSFTLDFGKAKNIEFNRIAYGENK